MKPLTVVANLKAKKGSEQVLGEALRKLVPITHREKGCMIYDMHQSHEDPGMFIFYENWETRADWEAHMKAPHLVAFADLQPTLAESWTLFVGEKVS
jgi:quinol monooxygenase YgiN